MFEPFTQLDTNCQLEICRAWMLDYDHEVKVFEVGWDSAGSPSLRSYRRAADNTLTLVNKSTHKLFESIVDTHAIYRLEVDGFTFDDAVVRWAGILPCSRIHFLQLQLDFSRPESSGSWWVTGPMGVPVRAPEPSIRAVRDEIDAGLASVTKYLTNFTNLRDIQLITLIDEDIFPSKASELAEEGDTQEQTPREACWKLRSYLLHSHANTLRGVLSKLAAVHVSFVKLQMQPEMQRQKLVDIANSTKKRTRLGWRHNLKYLEMSCTNGKDTKRLVAAVKEIGLKIERNGSGYLMVP